MDIEREYRKWIMTGNVPRYRDFPEMFRDGFPSLEEFSIRWFGQRQRTVRQYGFALPCLEAIKRLRKLSPIVEIGAGTGVWAHILAKNGVDIIATDQRFRTSYYHTAGRFHQVLYLDGVNAIRRYPDRNVLMIWPCYNAEWPTKVAREIRPGRQLALISEGEGGCVGADSLFQCLEKRFYEIDAIEIPRWYGIEDYLDIYQRVISR